MGLPHFSGLQFARNYFLDFTSLRSMKPNARSAQTDELFRGRLDEQLNMRHPLVRLAGLDPLTPLLFETGTKHLCFVPTWQENPLVTNCGDSCSP